MSPRRTCNKIDFSGDNLMGQLIERMEIAILRMLSFAEWNGNGVSDGISVRIWCQTVGMLFKCLLLNEMNILTETKMIEKEKQGTVLMAHCLWEVFCSRQSMPCIT